MAAFVFVWAFGAPGWAGDVVAPGKAAALAETAAHLQTAMLVKPGDIQRRVEARDGPGPDFALPPHVGLPALPVGLPAGRPLAVAAPLPAQDWHLPETRAPPAA